MLFNDSQKSLVGPRRGVSDSHFRRDDGQLTTGLCCVNARGARRVVRGLVCRLYLNLASQLGRWDAVTVTVPVGERRGPRVRQAHCRRRDAAPVCHTSMVSQAPWREHSDCIQRRVRASRCCCKHSLARSDRGGRTSSARAPLFKLQGLNFCLNPCVEHGDGAGRELRVCFPAIGHLKMGMLARGCG